MTTRRRSSLVVSVILTIALLAGVMWWGNRALSSFEERFIGQWTIPSSDINPKVGFVTSLGPVSRPWRVWEFYPDRSFRTWIISPDDARVHTPDLEGRWRAKEGRLYLEDSGLGYRVVRDVNNRLGCWWGAPPQRNIQGQLSHSVKFIDVETLEMTPPRGEPLTWKRREKVPRSDF